MGLGFRIDAPVAPRGLLRRRPRPRDVLDELEAACLACIDEPLLRELVRLTRDDQADRFDLWLHPAAGPIAWTVADGRVVCSAPTSAAGPGYHACAVELAERVGERAGLAWRWSGDDGEPGDECGYHETRDVEAVQAEMLGWLQTVAAWLMEHRTAAVRLGLSLDVASVEPGVISPLGVWERSWVEAVARADGDALAAVGERFFPWWAAPCDAEMWNRYGRVLAWTDVPWHAPDRYEERGIYDAAIAAFERCLALDPAAAVPERELAELRRLRAPGAAHDRPPDPVGIGFRRGPWQWRAGTWQVVAPGYYYRQPDEEALVLAFGDRVIRVAPRTIVGAPASRLSGLEPHAAAVGPDVAWEDGPLRARAHVFPDEGGDAWHLQGVVADDGTVCLATITFGDEADRAWAEEVFRGISRAPRAGGDAD